MEAGIGLCSPLAVQSSWGSLFSDPVNTLMCRLPGCIGWDVAPRSTLSVIDVPF